MNARTKAQIAALVTFLGWQVLWAVTREPGAGKSLSAVVGFTSVGVALGLLAHYGVTKSLARRGGQ